MVFIGFREGIMPCGNTGMTQCPWRVEWYRQKHAYDFAIGNDLDEVFIIENFTQKMCEMNASELRKYVLRNGRKMWDRTSHEQYKADAQKRASAVLRRRKSL